MALKIDGDMIGGELVGARRQPIAKFPRGRVCSHPECGTRLSVYNSNKLCAVHDFDNNLMHVGTRRSLRKSSTTGHPPRRTHPRAA